MRALGSISRELVECMGGQFGLSSESGRGSNFTLYVRAHRAAAPLDIPLIPQRTISPSPVRRASPTLNGTTLPLRVSSSVPLAEKPRVLLVEGNAINVQVLIEQLEKYAYTVYHASHGGEALDLMPRAEAWFDYQPIQKVEALSANLDIAMSNAVRMDMNEESRPSFRGWTELQRIFVLAFELGSTSLATRRDPINSKSEYHFDLDCYLELPRLLPSTLIISLSLLVRHHIGRRRRSSRSC